MGFPGGSVDKEYACDAVGTRDTDWIPGLGRFPGEWHGSPLQYSCLENLVVRGAWRSVIHRVAKSWTRLKGLSTVEHKKDAGKFCFWHI